MPPVVDQEMIDEQAEAEYIEIEANGSVILSQQPSHRSGQHLSTGHMAKPTASKPLS